MSKTRKSGGGFGRRPAFWIAAAALAGGAAIALSALWTPGKAVLGQYLLSAAYERARSGEEHAKPWSWADVSPLAKLRFPGLDDAERLVLDQASGEAMAWGPGWIRGSAPLGEPGLSAVAAHRDTHFALLKDLNPGDPIDLETLDGRKGRYRVVKGEVVDSRIWKMPVIVDGPDMLALSTCWPFDALQPGPMRYVIFAAREKDAASESGPAPSGLQAAPAREDG